MKLTIKDIRTARYSPEYENITKLCIQNDFTLNDFYKIYTWFPNIRDLYIDNYTDNLTLLFHFKKLHCLCISKCTSAFAIESLSKLFQLKKLRLGITDGNLEPLSTLVNLEVLSLKWYKNGDLSPLSTLKKLRQLELSSYERGNLGFIEGMKNLNYFDISSHVSKL